MATHMHTFDSLILDLKNMNIDPKGTLMIHSSMKAIGDVEGGADTVLDALIHYMRDGLLVLPTHTWESINEENSIYDSRTDPSCVGLLTNVFLKRPGVLRSLHPTHSVAALGRDAGEYISGEETACTPCPKDGCWGRLYSRNATILFIGCRFNRNTYLHSVEEWNNIPDRLSKGTSEMFIVDSKGNKHRVDMHRHSCSFTDDVSQNYVVLEPACEAAGILHRGSFGSASCIVCGAKPVADLATRLLELNPNLFSSMAPIPKEWY